MSDQSRKRAPGMTPEARREMIVTHTLPLLAEHGASVTTQLIAQAAGIGEATIFRAFEDKAAVLRACMLRVISPEPLLAGLTRIPLDIPLTGRLSQAAEELAQHSRRVGVVMESLATAGVRLHRDDLSHNDIRKAMHENRSRSLAVTADAIAVLLEPDAERFRVPVRTAATTFQFLVMALMRRPWARGPADDGPVPAGPETELEVDDVVDLFLHGALVPTEHSAEHSTEHSTEHEHRGARPEGSDIAC